jgi:hypothetical protein
MIEWRDLPVADGVQDAIHCYSHSHAPHYSLSKSLQAMAEEVEEESHRIPDYYYDFSLSYSHQRVFVHVVDSPHS